MLSDCLPWSVRLKTDQSIHHPRHHHRHLPGDLTSVVNLQYPTIQAVEKLCSKTGRKPSEHTQWQVRFDRLSFKTAQQLLFRTFLYQETIVA